MLGIVFSLHMHTLAHCVKLRLMTPDRVGMPVGATAVDSRLQLQLAHLTKAFNAVAV